MAVTIRTAMGRTVVALLGIGALLPATLAIPARAADAEAGQTIARRWCASCHLVEPGQKQAASDAPSFSDIAKRRGNDPKLADFLMDPHPKMPDMQIGREEAANVVAYIRSQAPR